jgi:hypothetical protein
MYTFTSIHARKPEIDYGSFHTVRGVIHRYPGVHFTPRRQLGGTGGSVLDENLTPMKIPMLQIPTNS